MNTPMFAGQPRRMSGNVSSALAQYRQLIAICDDLTAYGISSPWVAELRQSAQGVITSYTRQREKYRVT
jgi:hypothetical protein